MKMKFVLDPFWLSNDRLPYKLYDTNGYYIKGQYTIRKGWKALNGADELSILIPTDGWKTGYTHENILNYVCKKHRLDIRSAKQIFTNGHWKIYSIRGYDWNKHAKWAKPRIEQERISRISERLHDISNADLKKVIRYREKHPVS